MVRDVHREPLLIYTWCCAYKRWLGTSIGRPWLICTRYCAYKRWLETSIGSLWLICTRRCANERWLGTSIESPWLIFMWRYAYKRWKYVNRKHQADFYVLVRWPCVRSEISPLHQLGRLLLFGQSFAYRYDAQKRLSCCVILEIAFWKLIDHWLIRSWNLKWIAPRFKSIYT
jgi:hypothetical protein